jgi:hypothetical protein
MKKMLNKSKVKKHLYIGLILLVFNILYTLYFLRLIISGYMSVLAFFVIGLIIIGLATHNVILTIGILKNMKK